MGDDLRKVGVILEVTPTKWRELEHVIAENSSIIYVKRVPINVKLKIVETKGDSVRENERESGS